MEEKEISYLVEKYSDTVYRLSFSYLKNTHDAEDAVQEVFLKLVEKRGKFENDEHEKAWILRVTINICKNKLKQSWKRKVGFIEDVGELAEGNAIECDDTDTVMSAVMTLNEAQRTVIHLYYYEGYKTVEIAEILKKSDSGIRSTLCRARERLQILLKEDYDFE